MPSFFRSRKHKCPRNSRIQRRGLLLEALEDRRLLTVWTVNDLGDSVSEDGKLTLREAIEAAVADNPRGDARPGGSVDDEIRFAESLYTSADGNSTFQAVIDLTSTLKLDGASSGGGPNRGSLTIIGPGMDLLAIDGGDVTNIFTVEDTVNIVGLELKGSQGAAITTAVKPEGSSSSAEIQMSFVTLDGVRVTGNLGGGIEHFEGTLEIRNSEITNNSTPGFGGGILVATTKRLPNASGNFETTSPSAFIASSTISNNSSTSGGGGVANIGASLSIVDSELSVNTTEGKGGGLVAGAYELQGTRYSAKTSVFDSTLRSNTAGDSGGAIRSLAGQLTVGESSLVDNTATTDGGGISFFADEASDLLDVRATTISGNRAVNGAGIDHIGGAFDMLGSTLNGNVSSGGGGGIALHGVAQKTSIANSTISGNSATLNGGGVWQDAGAVAFTNTTIVLNRAGAMGGGLAVNNGPGARMVNALVAGNTRGTSTPSDIELLSGTSINAARTYHNLVGDPATSGGLVGTPQQDPKGRNVNLDFNFNVIGNLNENNVAVPWDIERIIFPELSDKLGGPTAIHALKVDSPAIDNGSPIVPSRREGIPVDENNNVIFPPPILDENGAPLMDDEGNTLTEGYPDALPSDQRGYPYTRFTLESFGENKNDQFAGGFAATDIGAFEAQKQPLTRSQEIVVSTLFDESDGDFRYGDLSLREAIEIANLSSDHNTIRFAPNLLNPDPNLSARVPLGFSSKGVAATIEPLRILTDMTISGPGANEMQVFGGLNEDKPDTRIFEIAPFTNVTISGITLVGGVGTEQQNQSFGVFDVPVVDGGAIFNAGNTTIVDSIIADGRAKYGAGIYNTGKLEIRNTQFFRNKAEVDGGSIYNNGGNITYEGGEVFFSDARQGGGVFVNGRMTISDVTFMGNRATSAGGAIFVDGDPFGEDINSTLEIRRSQIGPITSGNNVLQQPNVAPMGAGIANYGGLSVFDTTIEFNRSDDTGTLRPKFVPDHDDVQGAGIFSSSQGREELIIERSTIRGNRLNTAGTARGGGLFIASGFPGGEASPLSSVIISSTISDNTANGQTESSGGGVYIAYNQGTFPRILDTTIAFNRTSDGAAKRGSGLFFDGVDTILNPTKGVMELGNSIISNNTGAGEEVFITAGEIRVLRKNVILEGSVTGGPLKDGNGRNDAPASLTETRDPALGPLTRDNGGFTATHRLSAAAAINGAVDAGDREGLLDQRGFPITDVIDVPGDKFADIGAYESDQIFLEPFTAEVNDASQFGTGPALVLGQGIDEGPNKPNSTIPKEPGFLGLEFDPDPFTLGPGIASGKFGGEATADIDGRVGIEYGYYVNSGSVDTFYNGMFAYSIDNPVNGGPVTINTGLTLDDGGVFTVSPRISAYADLVFEFNAAISGQACFFSCGGGSFNINIDESTPLLSINRQVMDEETGEFVFGDNGELLFDGDIVFAGNPIKDLILGALPPEVEQAGGISEYILDQREAARKAEIDNAMGKGDKAANDQIIKEARENEKKVTKKKSGKIGGGKFITVDVGEADGDLLGLQVDLGIGFGASVAPGVDASIGKNLGSLQLTIPDVQLVDTEFDDPQGTLSATTDDFEFGSDQDAKRQVAALSVDVAAIGPFGTYTAELGPIDVTATTISYNITPRFAIKQDIEVVPTVGKARFTFGGSFANPITVNGVSKSSGGFVEFNPGDSIVIDTKGQDVDIVPSLEIKNRFSNEIGLDFDVRGLLEVLALELNAFGANLLDIGPLYEDEHQLLEPIDVVTFFDETFDLPTERFTLTDTKDRNENGNTTENLVIKIGPNANRKALPANGTVPGQAIPLASGQAAQNLPGITGTEIYFAVPLVDADGVLHNEVRITTSGTETALIRPPYGGMTLEILDGDVVTNSFKIPVEGYRFGGSNLNAPSSFRLVGFENLLGGQAIFGLEFSQTPTSLTATAEGGDAPDAVTLLYDNSVFLGSEPNGVTAASQRAAELMSNGFVVDNDLAFDADGNGVISATSDGVLVANYFDARATGLSAFSVTGAVGQGASRDTASSIFDYLKTLDDSGRLDVDGDGDVDDVDKILIARRLSGVGVTPGNEAAFITAELTIPQTAKRRTARDIIDFIDIGGRRPPTVSNVDGAQIRSRSDRGVSPSEVALGVDDSAVVGSSPWLPVMEAFSSGQAVFTLTTFGQTVQYQDTFLDDTIDPTKKFATGAVGTPSRLLPLPNDSALTNDLQEILKNPLAEKAIAIQARGRVETRQQELGVDGDGDNDEPIFVEVPFQRTGVAGYRFSLPAGATFSKLVLDPAVGGNALLKHTQERDGTDNDFDLVIEGSTQSISMDAITMVGANEFLLLLPELPVPNGQPAPESFTPDLPDLAVLQEENKSQELDLNLKVGLVILSPGSSSPELTVTVLSDRTGTQSTLTTSTEIEAETDTQVVTLTPSATSVSANGFVDVDVEYQIDQLGANVPPALVLEIHYDSTRMTFNSASNVMTDGLVNSSNLGILGPEGTATGQPLETVPDGDLRTDAVVVLSFADFRGSWQGDATTSKTRLATLQFQATTDTAPTSIRTTGLSSADFALDTSDFVTINSPNKAPSFTANDPPAVEKNSGAQSVIGFATFDPGADEASQTVAAYIISDVTNPSLFTTGPAIDADGDLTYELAADVSGTSRFTVVVQDSGGTDNGGVDKSVAKTFTITVTDVGANKAPSFTATNPPSVLKNSGAQTVPGFATFDPGDPSESTQTVVAYIVSGVSNPSLFSVKPTIDTAGNLTYTAAVDAVGISRFTVVVQDSGGTAGGGTDRSLAQTFTITVNAVVPANQMPSFTATDPQSVLQNSGEQRVNGFATFNPGSANESSQMVVAYRVSNITNPALFSSPPAIDAAGNLTYTSATDAVGMSDFTVVVQDDGGTANGGIDTSLSQTFTITVVPQPSVTVTLNDVSLVAGETAAVTFTFSVPPTGFDSDDVTAENGTLSAIAPTADPNVFTATFTPTPDLEDATNTISVAAGYTDANGNTGTAGVSANYTIDTLSPTVAITLDDTALMTGETATATFTFSEPPTGFDNADVTAQNGTLSAIAPTADPNVFTATFTPTPDLEDATNTISVAAGYTDANGNTGTAGVSANYIVDTLDLMFDFGDAPSTYPVTLADDGARHRVGSLFLGSTVDAEADGQPDDAAGQDETGGDDNHGDADEDGVVVLADLISVTGSQTTSSFRIIASADGKLDAWIDFNQDNLWDAGEQIFDSVDVTAGNNVLSFSIPAGATVGDTAARFRLSSAGDLDSTGAASDGEVEDYIASIEDGSTAPDISVDLPDTVATLIVVDGMIVVRGSGVDLFSVSISNAGKLDVGGNDKDNVITLDLSGGSVIPPGGLNVDGGGGNNALRVTGSEANLDFTAGGNIAARNFIGLDLTDPAAQQVTIDAATVSSLAAAGRLIVRAGDDDTIIFGDQDDWRMGQTSVVDDRFVRSVTNIAGGDETIDTELPHAWQNVVMFGDANNSGNVTAGDALIIISELSRRLFSDADSSFLKDPLTVEVWPGVYYDQNGDDKATALDALRVINELARQRNQSNRSSGEAVSWAWSWTGTQRSDGESLDLNTTEDAGTLVLADASQIQIFNVPDMPLVDPLVNPTDHPQADLSQGESDWEATLRILSEDISRQIALDI